MADITSKILRPIWRLIDMGDGTHAPRMAVEMASNLMTDGNSEVRRLRVDVGQTGFFAGREFRTFLELDISNTLTIQVNVPLDVILFNLQLDLVEGGARIATIVGGTPSGSFGVTMPVIPVNSMSNAPAYTPLVTLAHGGSVSGGTVLDVLLAQTSNIGSAAQSVGAGGQGERGIAAGTYYYQIEPTSGSNLVAVFRGRWEERPVGSY